MPNSQERAKRYRDRSQECLRLSRIAPTAAVRQHYERMAAAYLSLAEAEERLAGKRIAPVREAGT